MVDVTVAYLFEDIFCHSPGTVFSAGLCGKDCAPLLFTFIPQMCSVRFKPCNIFGQFLLYFTPILPVCFVMQEYMPHLF